MKSFASAAVILERPKDDLRRPLERAAGKPDHSGPASQRAPQYPERVRDETLRWLAALPEHVRPVELTRRYPRIANKLATIWRRVARCEEYLDELVVDKRGGRRGFSMAVAQELAVLRRHYAALHPAGNGVWEMEGKGR
jgi:hypothetical protein